MKLYKYCAASRISDLENRRIRFTQACEFNDPFDLSPTYDFFSQEDQRHFASEDQADGGDGSSFVLTPQRLSKMLDATKLGREFLERKVHWSGGSQVIDNPSSTESAGISLNW